MIDVSAVAVVDGTTDVIGPPVMLADERHERAVLLQLLPAESVEDQEQHLRRVEARSRGTTPGAPSRRGPSSVGTTFVRHAPA